MNILIANNRSITANELTMLVNVLSKNHDVTVCAMAQEVSHRAQAFLFANEPTRVDKSQGMANKSRPGEKQKPVLSDDCAKYPIYEFYSNPADMISIMLGEVMRTRRPDIVICGVSNGTNMGPDIYPSSNVGMAMECAFFGVPAIVVATEFASGGNTPATIWQIACFIEKNLEKFVSLQLPPRTFLNINFPRVERYLDLKGVKYTRMGKMNLMLEFIEKRNPKGGTYYWAKRSRRENLNETHPDDEVKWYDAGYVTITPLCYDCTDYDVVATWGGQTERMVDSVECHEQTENHVGADE